MSSTTYINPVGSSALSGLNYGVALYFAHFRQASETSSTTHCYVCLVLNLRHTSTCVVPRAASLQPRTRLSEPRTYTFTREHQMYRIDLQIC